MQLVAGTAPQLNVGFEAPDFSLGSVDGQRGWKVEQGVADIVQGSAHEGTQSLRLVAASPFSQARLRLDAASTAGSVNFIDFWVRPVASKADPKGEMLEIDGARIGFFLDDQAPGKGVVWLFDARDETDGEWIRTAVALPVDARTGESIGWVRITLREDFTRQTWDCWIGGVMTAADFGFQEPHVAFTENYIIMGDSVENVFLDDLTISSTNPFGPDHDADGITDKAENGLGTQVYFDDRDGDADADGQSNIAQFIASGLNHPPLIGEGAVAPPGAPAFSHPSGFADQPFLLELSGAADGGSIRFTTDGSDPRQFPRLAARYAGPISVTKTTVVRAAQLDAAGRVSSTGTAAWVFPDSVPDQIRPEGVPPILRDLGRGASVFASYPLPFGMRTRGDTGPTWPARDDVVAALRAAPVVVLTTEQAGLFSAPDGLYHSPGSLARDAKTNASLTAFGFEGDTVLSAPEALVSISGDSSRYHDVTIKHSFRVRFPQAAPLAAAGLLGPGIAPARQLVLRHPTQDSWTVGAQWTGQRKSAHYFNDALAAQTLRALGHPALARRWVHLFLNRTYWGLYEAIEQLSPGPEAIALVEADEAGLPRAIFGSAVGWQELLERARGLATQAGQRIVAETEWASIRERTDEPGLIDYLLVNVWMANSDWPVRNHLIVEGGDGFSFLPWDAELSLDADAAVNETSAETVFLTGSGPAGLFAALCASADFRHSIRQRLVSLTMDGGQLAPEAWTASLAAASALESLLPAEAARW